MMGLEFAGDVPFTDVYVHSVIQAPDGRRMSKSLGTGIDPLDVIDEHGADAVRFGLLAMSSTQDVRFSSEKVAAGPGSSRTSSGTPRASCCSTPTSSAARRRRAPRRVEDRWILSRLEQRTRDAPRRIDEFDFSHAALGLYDFVYGELCDWYLELVKPRLDEATPTLVGDAAARAASDARAGAPGDAVRDRGDLVVRARRRGPARRVARARAPTRTAVDADAERAIGARDRRGHGRCARWRDEAGVPPGRGSRRGSRRRLRRDGAARRAPGAARPRGRRTATRPVATCRCPAARSRCSPATRVDLERAGRARREQRAASSRPRSRAPRASSPTSGFVAKAPAEVVDAERDEARALRASSPSCSERVTPRPAIAATAAQDAERYLLGLELFGMRFGLDRMRRLMTALGLAAAALRLDPRRRHQRQVLDGADDRRDPRAPRAAHRRLHLAAPASRSPSASEIDERDLEPERVRRGGRSAPRARPSWSTARSTGDDRVTQFEALTAAALPRARAAPASRSR